MYETRKLMGPNGHSGVYLPQQVVAMPGGGFRFCYDGKVNVSSQSGSGSAKGVP